jgi:translation initiation factor 2 subunit 1
MDLESGDIVLCTVDRIVGTTVFVHIEENGEGSIVFSEIAPGRIRNIRDYVVPKKKIVCKILRISGDRIDLSLRRVTQKEQKEIKEKNKLEKSYESIIKSVLGEKAKTIIEEILKKEKVLDFLQRARENPKELEKIVGIENSKKILEILNSQQKSKIAVVKKEITLKSTASDGIEAIKNILEDIKGLEIRYISAGRYSLEKEDKDLKEADQKLREIIEIIEKKAKSRDIDFSIIKK